MLAAGGTKLAVILVGLPARGKTYIGRKVWRYLEWLGVSCRVFNVGDYRRIVAGEYHGHDFFSTDNLIAERIRNTCAEVALKDMLMWFTTIRSGVGIYDATNSSLKRRKMLYDACTEKGMGVMFVESLCDDDELVLRNIREVKRTSPDYKKVGDFKVVEKDFMKRIEHYKSVYQTLGGKLTKEECANGEEYDESVLTYVKKVNVGAQIIINRINDYIQSRIVYFLMNIHITPRAILFSRHGESIYNLSGLLGGDSGLSENGKEYMEALPTLINKIMGDQRLTVWTSSLKRTIETASKLPYKKIAFKALDEIDAGLCDGMTYKQVAKKYPDEYLMRRSNKFGFRYRGGESYLDVVLRLEPIIMELERQQNVMIVSHQAVLRCIYAYFLQINPKDLPYIKIPLHTVIKLTWTAYGCMVQKYSLGIEAVDTHENTASILGEKIVTKSTGEAIGDMLSTNEQLARKVGLKAISSGTNIELSYKDPEILQCVTSSGETKSLVLNESTEHHQFSHATTPSLTGQIPLENTSSVVDKDARSVRSILPPIKTELEPAYNLPMYSPAFTTEDITQLTGGSRKPQPRDVIPQPISIKTDGLGPEPGLGARETNTANIRTGSCITPASLAYPVSAHISSSIEDMISVKLSNLYTPAQLLNFNDPRINLTSISAYPHNSIISTDVSPEATRAQTPAPNPLPLQHLSGVLANAVALPSVSASTSTDPAALSNHINPTSENIDNVITGLDVDTTTLPQPPNNGKNNKNDNSTQYSGLHNLLLKKHLS